MNLKDIMEAGVEAFSALRSVKTVSSQLEEVGNRILNLDRKPGAIEVVMLWADAMGVPRCRVHFDKVMPGQWREMKFTVHEPIQVMPRGTWVILRGPAVFRAVIAGMYSQLDGNGSTLVVTSHELNMGQQLLVKVEGVE